MLKKEASLESERGNKAPRSPSFALLCTRERRERREGRGEREGERREKRERGEIWRKERELGKEGRRYTCMHVGLVPWKWYKVHITPKGESDE